jgi:hypothetical protein
VSSSRPASGPPPKIFLSYRRDDAGALARVFYEALDQRFPGRVFLDVAEVEPGVDFVSAIDTSMRESGACVALIGPRWMAVDATGRARLQDERDYVRREIAAALDRKILLIPIELPGASMPRASDLPADIAGLTRLNALEMFESKLADGVQRVVGLIERHFGEDRDRVRLSGMLSNQGWTVYIDIQDLDVQEIAYRIDGKGTFRSTGFETTRDRATGRAQARRHFSLPSSARRHDVEIRYTDLRGRDHGPYTVAFDAQAELVRSTRSILEMTPQWITFAVGGEESKVLVYFSHLLSYKAALQEIRFSVDDDSLNRTLRFVRSAEDPTHGIDPADEMIVEIPKGTRSIWVHLTYADGTRSEAMEFELPAKLN